MKVHHLNCGSFCPLTIPILNPHPLAASCHCLLLETESGLVLIDSGYSTLDVDNPSQRLGLSSVVLGLKMKREETAFAQVQALGFRPQDVQHIVLTHLDPDHVGGISDFPWAQVHIFEEEFHLVRQLSQAPGKYRNRFRPQNWQPETQWNFYPIRGEPWKGFTSVRQLKGLPPEILLVPLVGHSPGHCGVAVHLADHWLLHAGDAYFQRQEISPQHVELPVVFQVYQSLLAFNNRERMDNQKRLRDLLRKSPDLEIFCAHDMKEMIQYSKDAPHSTQTFL